MSNNDYAQGFKDGWKAAMEEMEKMPPNRNHLQPHMHQNFKKIDPPIDYKACPVCGAIGVRFQVCYHERCPSKISFTNTITTNKTDGWGSEK